MVEVKGLDLPLIIQEQVATQNLFHQRSLFFSAIITFKKHTPIILYHHDNKLFGNGFYPKIRKALDEQNSNSYTFSLPSLHDYYVKIPNFTFCGGREDMTKTFFFFS